jgi:hypothetical protein
LEITAAGEIEILAAFVFLQSLRPHDLPQRHPAIGDEPWPLDRVHELMARIDT